MNINNEIVKKLQNCNNVAIFVHVKPDGDCLGSATAMYLALTKLNKNVDMFTDSPISDNFKFMAAIDNFNKPKCKSYDIGLSLDVTDAKRMGECSSIFHNCAFTIAIDHHIIRDNNFASINCCEPLSSTCIILYEYILALGVVIDKEIAQSLYSGIATDTGGFIHSNTTSLEHYVCGKLIETNFDLEKVNYYLFKNKTIEQFNLLKVALGNSRFYLDNKLGLTYLTKSDFKKTNSTNLDTMGLVNMVTNVNTCEIGICISEEKQNLFSVSFRSQGNADVSYVACLFGGGGHKRASGCNIFGSLNSVIDKLVEACKRELNKLK